MFARDFRDHEVIAVRGVGGSGHSPVATCPVVAGHREDAGSDGQLPPRALRERAGLLADGGQHRGGRVDELGRGERRGPQPDHRVRDRRLVEAVRLGVCGLAGPAARYGT